MRSFRSLPLAGTVIICLHQEKTAKRSTAQDQASDHRVRICCWRFYYAWHTDYLLGERASLLLHCPLTGSDVTCGNSSVHSRTSHTMMMTNVGRLVAASVVKFLLWWVLLQVQTRVNSAMQPTMTRVGVCQIGQMDWAVFFGTEVTISSL